MLDNESPLLSLSEDLKYHITSFLSGVDLLRLIESCSTLYQELPFSSLSPPYTLHPIQEWEGDDHLPRKGPRVPILYARRTHSITLRSRHWSGPGGSRIFLVAFQQDPASPSNDPISFADGMVVAESVTSNNQGRPLKLSFQPEPGKDYYLWYQGRSVQTNRIHVHTVILDFPNRACARRYRQSNNPICPFGSIFIHVLWQSLLASGDGMD